jgi:enterochelin esterase-like enzyme
MPVFINVGAVHVAANVLIHEHKIAPMILVMPAGKTGTLGADTEWADTPSGRWMSYLIDVVHDVDHRFSTYADRQHRGIAGDSLGGYAAMNVGLHHLGDFSVIQSWGGYFTQTPTGVFKGATAASLAENSPASYLASLRRTIHKRGLRTWLFQGRTDSADPALMTGFATQLHDAGADVHVGFFPGGHDWGLFRAQTPRMLVAAGRWFAQKPKSKARPPGFKSIGRALPASVLQQITARRQARCLALKPTQHIRPSCRRFRAAHGIH